MCQWFPSDDTAGIHLVNALLDAPVRLLCKLVHGEPVLHLLDGPRHRGCDFLDASLDRRLEEGDVALPSWRPLVGLAMHALVAPRGHEVEWDEGTDASRAKGERLDSGRGGDAERHDEDMEWLS